MVALLDLVGGPLDLRIPALPAIVAIAVVLIGIYLLARRKSIVQLLPGPISTQSWLLGNYHAWRNCDASSIPLEYVEKYGDIVKFKGFMRQDHLQITDHKAISHMLQSNPYGYGKSRPNQERLTRMTGESIAFVNGDDHKRHRRILNPAFLEAPVNEQAAPMFQYSNQLKDRWSGIIRQEKTGSAVINVFNEYAKVALDIIGKAGFNSEFGCVKDDSNPLAKCFEGAVAKTFAAAPEWFTGLNEAAQYLPLPLFQLQKLIPMERFQALHRAMRQMRKAASSLMTDGDMDDGDSDSRRDMLSILLKSNKSEASRALTNAEVIYELTGLIIGGHETTANTLSWTTWSLSLNRAVQTRLREECRAALDAAGDDELSVEALNALPYLDCVTKEALRLHVVFERLERVAEVDDVLPLNKPVTLTNGQVVDRIPVSIGQRIFVPLAVLNWSEEIWGPDAREFRPERWLTENLATKTIPTVYAGLSTFGAGARSCIGYRMAILELKVVLCVMAANFKFEPRDGPPIDVRRISSNFMIPLVVGEEAEGPQMPIKVTRIE